MAAAPAPRPEVRRKLTFVGGEPTLLESVEAIRGSYAVIDPHGRFFDSAGGGDRYSAPILEVGLAAAFVQVSFDPVKFLHRGGDYDFTTESAGRVQVPLVSRPSADVREEADLALPV